MLEVRNLSSGYNRLPVLHNVGLRAVKGKITAIVGPNGAGKSTLLQAIVGALEVGRGTSISFDGNDVTRLQTHILARRGLRLVSETMNLFTAMTILENLILGANPASSRSEIENDLQKVFSVFPRLKERTTQLSGTLSGGERKMLAIGRAMMGRPQLLLVDEPSLGLSPKVSLEVFDTLRRLNTEGMTVLVVEQRVRSAIDISSFVYVLERGEIVLQGASEEIEANEHIQRNYLAVI